MMGGVSTPSGLRNSGGKRREKEVVDAAADIFYRQGYSETTVEQIANALGILKGSLYHYISSKEDLLFRVLEEVHEEVGEVMVRVLAEEGLTPVQRLRLYVREQVEYNARHVTRISVYYRDMEYLGADRLAMIQGRRREHEKLLVGLVRDAQEQGEIPEELDARLSVACIFATIIWTYTWYRPGGRTRPPQLAEFCADFVVRGLAAGQPHLPPSVVA